MTSRSEPRQPPRSKHKGMQQQAPPAKSRPQPPRQPQQAQLQRPPAEDRPPPGVTAKSAAPSNLRGDGKGEGKGAGKGDDKEVRHRNVDRQRNKDEDLRVLPRIGADGWRTPFAHRRGHMYPRQLSKAVAGFPAKWARHLADNDNKEVFRTAKGECNIDADENAVDGARKFMHGWLRARFLNNCRVIHNVQKEDKFLSASLWITAGRLGDLAGDQRPGSVADDTGVWDLYMTDFNPLMWTWVKETKSQRMQNAWIQWHGTNLYGLSSALATNFLARSESNEKGHALAMGRGVYTAQDFRKALQYSTPHVFQEDGLKVLVRGILLVRLPKTGHTSKCNIQCVTAT